MEDRRGGREIRRGRGRGRGSDIVSSDGGYRRGRGRGGGDSRDSTRDGGGWRERWIGRRWRDSKGTGRHIVPDSGYIVKQDNSR